MKPVDGEAKIANSKKGSYKVSHKPIIWSLFAAGGTLTALLMPVLVVLVALAVPVGYLPAELFSYARIHELLASPIVKLIVFAVVFLSLWHSAHRMRITVHDFGLRADSFAVFVFYGIAAVASIFLVLAII
jgi:fumarate reductase subunit D